MGWFKCPLRQVKKLEVKNLLLEADVKELNDLLDAQAAQIKGFEATVARLNNKDKKCVKNCKDKNKNKKNNSKAVKKDTVASGKGKAKPTATNAKKSSAKKDSK